MSDTVISVENVSKKYRLGEARHDTLRDRIMHTLRRAFRRNGAVANESEFWALRDVSFEVKRGEVLGIIGRNGAGKSTLLKILSRITEPTTGRISLRGRVASLLEVGTGFHPELSGRENIFLNGAILGMSRQEIRSKFDEIVAFAEVERFLDTPVKHYSSGMYVRLAFAVAAHLEPEILIVDEVLAVGDAAFQKKCLSKMESVSLREGRTVLFVSHNLDSIQRLCSTGILLAAGQLKVIGPIQTAVQAYGTIGVGDAAKVMLAPRARSAGLHGRAALEWIATRGGPWRFWFGEDIALQCGIRLATTPPESLFLTYAIFSPSGFEIASSQCRIGRSDAGSAGPIEIELRIQQLRLAPGTYILNLGLRSEIGEEDFVPDAVGFEIQTNDDAANEYVDLIRAACVPIATSQIIRTIHR